VVLGHATVTAAAHRVLGGRWPRVKRLPLGLLVLGAYAPDLVDKPISLLTELGGRSYGHSLLGQLSLFGVLWLAAGPLRPALLGVWLGATVHLLQDAVEPSILLAPLLGPFPVGAWDPSESLFGFYLGGGPPVWVEIAALGYWVAVAVRTSGRRSSRQLHCRIRRDDAA